jgi:hypothetical protein
VRRRGQFGEHIVFREPDGIIPRRRRCYQEIAEVPIPAYVVRVNPVRIIRKEILFMR